MKGHDSLLVVPALRAERGPGGSFVLTQKFLEGVATYCKYWPGPVVVAIQRIDRVMDNLDHVAVHPDSQPFSLRWLDTAEDSVSKLIGEARFVLSSLVPQHERMARLCADAGVPMAFVTEYSLRTRQQIIRAETRNPLRRWRRLWYEAGRERRNLEAVRLATGLQCNGTPTFEAYRSINPAALLFFDNRVRADMVAAPQTVEARTKQMKSGGPLRLAFSGRFTAMKGVHHLPRVAAELQRQGVDFTLDIFGGGVLEERMTRQIERLGLVDRVRLRGVLDFESELLPHLAREVDLFVVCHLQGDPSCTYLETMSCGVPIVGYANEAFEGMVRMLGVGWTTPLGEPAPLARRIAELNADRDGLTEAAHASRTVAAERSFERTMRARVDHMLACCDAALVEVGAA